MYMHIYACVNRHCVSIYCGVESGHTWYILRCGVGTHTVYTEIRSRDIHGIYCAAESGHTQYILRCRANDPAQNNPKSYTLVVNGG